MMDDSTDVNGGTQGSMHLADLAKPVAVASECSAQLCSGEDPWELPGENQGKPIENHGKLWENQGKPRNTKGNYGKPRKIRETANFLKLTSVRNKLL